MGIVLLPQTFIFYYPNPKPYINFDFFSKASLLLKVDKDTTAVGASPGFLHDHPVVHTELAPHKHKVVNRV